MFLSYFMKHNTLLMYLYLCMTISGVQIEFFFFQKNKVMSRDVDKQCFNEAYANQVTFICFSFE